MLYSSLGHPVQIRCRMPAQNWLTILPSSRPQCPAFARTDPTKPEHLLRPIWPWRAAARWARRKLATAPAAVRIAFVVGGALDKVPSETWQQYGLLFREYSTDTTAPELLAALAQIESTGNPVARTHWRWRLTRNPFGVYKPASSAVGLYQMTDAAYAEASRYCVRRRAVVTPTAGSTAYISARCQAPPSNSRRCTWTAASRRSRLVPVGGARSRRAYPSVRSCAVASR